MTALFYIKGRYVNIRYKSSNGLDFATFIEEFLCTGPFFEVTDCFQRYDYNFPSTIVVENNFHFFTLDT